MYVPVYWGGGSELLEKGACQATASSAIGADGNSVISAHVNTFFNNLGNIKTGDTVVLHTNYGRFTYNVSELIEFDASDETYIKNTDDNRLTLYTCDMNLLGSSSKRIGAVCTLEKSEFYSSEEALEENE
jgi:sortase A